MPKFGTSPSTWISTPVIFMLLASFGFLARLYISTLGHNYDLESYVIVSDLVAGGQNVYAGTPRYNYGPVWFLILGALRHLRDALGFQDLQGLHLLVACFLSFVDLVIAMILRTRYGLFAAVFFLLNPVSLLITGYHSQFDNLAVLFALISWIMLERARANDSLAFLMGSSFVMGLSLVTKHIMLFFPLWILLGESFIPIRRRVAWVGLAYSIFFLSFVPWAVDPVGLTGIVDHVFRYRSFFGNGLLPSLWGGLASIAGISWDFATIADTPIPMATFFLMMIGTGALVARFDPKHLFPWYLVAMLAWTPSIADQYLAIPLVAVAIMTGRWPVWVYLTSATVILIGSIDNIGALPALFPVTVKVHVVRERYAFVVAWLLILLVNAVREWIATAKVAKQSFKDVVPG
jgi:hypothetical protein